MNKTIDAFVNHARGGSGGVDHGQRPRQRKLLRSRGGAKSDVAIIKRHDAQRASGTLGLKSNASAGASATHIQSASWHNCAKSQPRVGIIPEKIGVALIVSSGISSKNH